MSCIIAGDRRWSNTFYSDEDYDIFVYGVDQIVDEAKIFTPRMYLEISDENLTLYTLLGGQICLDLDDMEEEFTPSMKKEDIATIPFLQRGGFKEDQNYLRVHNKDNSFNWYFEIQIDL